MLAVAGFTAVIFEADWPAMQAANEYTHRLRASPFPEEIRFPKWMWHNQCMADFFEWCKKLEPAAVSVYTQVEILP